MRNILTKFRYILLYDLTPFIINKSGIEIIKNPEYHRHMKYLDLQYYWLRNAVQDSVIIPVHILSSQNMANIFTKAVQSQVVTFAISRLGLMP